MAYERKPGDIAVFKEKDKRNERGPDWKGQVVIPLDAKPGDTLEVALWARGDYGTMLAGNIKPARQQDEGERFPGGADRGVSGGGRDDQPGRGDRRQYVEPADDEIPF